MELDYFIIDLPPGTGDAQLSLVQSIQLSGGVIVTLPQAISLEDASRGLQMFNQLNVPILGVIENMSFLELPDGQRMEVFGSGGGQKLADEANTALLGKIPMAPDVRIGGDTGKPVLVSEPESKVAQEIRNIAEQLAAKLSVAAMEKKPGIKLDIVG